MILINTFENTQLVINEDKIISIAPGVQQTKSDQEILIEAGINMDILNGKTRVTDPVLFAAEQEKAVAALDQKTFEIITDPYHCVIYMEGDRNVKVAGTLEQTVTAIFPMESFTYA